MKKLSGSGITGVGQGTEIRRMKIDNNKSFRLLHLFEKLNRGEIVNKKDFAASFGISEKSVQRDIEDLRAYLAECYESGDDVTVEYDAGRGGYRLIKAEREFFTNQEILALAKVLLESRGFNKNEMDALIDKLLLQATPSARVNIKEMILHERFHYIPPRHGKPLIEAMWTLGGCIHNHERIAFDYTRLDGTTIHEVIEPLAIMFSEYYFYLIAWYADHLKNYPVVFRIDRIVRMKTTGEKFRIPYADRFDEGEFRKRVAFMFPGELKTITFTYTGLSVEAILDRIPTAQIMSLKDGVYRIKAECYGDGVLMWLRTQGERVKMTE